MNSAIKTTLYIGSGKPGAAKVKEIESEIAKKRDGVEAVSALMIYAFDFLHAIDPRLEDEAAHANLSPAEFVNSMFDTYLKTKRKVA
jgi:hypothetical protein